MQIDPLTRAKLIALLKAHVAQQRSVAVAGSRGVPFDTTGGAEGLINRLNSMSQAEVNQLMAQPNFLSQFTPKGYNNPLAQAGVPAGLMRDVTNLNNLFDPNMQSSIDKRLVNVRRMGGVSAGMAAERNVRNQVQQHDYKRMADNASAATRRQLSADEAALGESLARLRRQTNYSGN